MSAEADSEMKVVSAQKRVSSDMVSPSDSDEMAAGRCQLKADWSCSKEV